MKWVKEGLDLYSGRLGHYVPFAVTEIPEIKVTASATREQVREKEGELILKNVRPQDDLILLDERGEQRSSKDFAAWLEGRMSRGGKDMVFVVGGAFGFSRKVYDRADSMMSLSKMTFSHQIVRTIFAEQLYRAFTIMRGEPYHHE